jgi:hypothetical protein
MTGSLERRRLFFLLLDLAAEFLGADLAVLTGFSDLGTRSLRAITSESAFFSSLEYI